MLKIEGTVEHEGKLYEWDENLARYPKFGEAYWNLAGGVSIADCDFETEYRFILREVKPQHVYKAGDWVRVKESRYGIAAGTETQITRVDAQGHYWLSGKLTHTLYRNGTCWVGTEFEPCDPPAPKYRPFANAAEFLPYANRLLKYTHNAKNHYLRVDAFNDECWMLSGDPEDQDYQYMVDHFVFADTGEPAGVKIDG